MIKVKAMKVVKWISVFCVVVVLGTFSEATYGQESIAKAPHSDHYKTEYDDPRTIKELENITKGEIEGVITGRNPVSIDGPQDHLPEQLKGVNDLRRSPKENTFRAPAIPKPKSITLSQGI